MGLVREVRVAMGLGKVNVVGAGHVGLPLAMLLAKAGIPVLCVDTNPDLISAINNRSLILAESDLQKLFDDPDTSRNLSASRNPQEADAFVIAVPTPLAEPRRVCDMSPVMNALKAIAPVLKRGNLINLESTIPPLTCRDVVAPWLRGLGFEPGKDIYLTHCPERILPGDVFREIVHNDRIIGGFSEECAKRGCEMYAPFLKGKTFLTDATTAELCKLMENTFRDVNIALANELAVTANKLGVDIYKAIDMANHHPRVKFLHPGIGVGGHCLAVDPWFISEVAPESGTIITAARVVNDNMPAVVASRIRRLTADVKNPRLLILGSTYKPETTDPRNSPAMDVFELLRVDGYDIDIYDPMVDRFKKPSLMTRLAERKPTHLFNLVPHKALISELNALGASANQVQGLPIFTVQDLIRGSGIKEPSRAHHG